MAGQAAAGDGHAAAPPKDARAAAAAAKKAARKKAAKAAKRDVAAARAAQAAANAARARRAAGFTVSAAAVEYVPEEIDSGGGGGGDAMDAAGPGASAEAAALADLQRVFAKFSGAGGGEEGPSTTAAAAKATSDDEDGGGGGSDDEADDAYGTAATAGESKKSRRARKTEAASRVAALKRSCARPDVVEAWDTTAPDPELLVALKANRNAVPVPRHWSQKRAYLAGKRGLERPPFELPAFIAATGVGEMRAAYAEKEAAASLKSAARARVRPKAGKLDLDYQVLHDAFFVHQTKPPMSGFGQVYYEGKEFEPEPPLVTPGRLSEELREALGMPPADPRAPPPFLVSMQRWGPPPSYPRLAIPGLSAPLPPGASYGYQAGGWGKPPVDEAGRPLYGDAFGDGLWVGAPAGGGSGGPGGATADDEPPVDKTARWGELAPDEEEEEEEEEGAGEEDVAMAEEDEAAGTATGLASGMATLAGAGLATPASLDLRKGTESTLAGAAAAPPPPSGPPPALYQVLEQRSVPLGAPGAALVGSDHVYAMPSTTTTATAAAPAGKKGKVPASQKQGTAVALDPAALEGLDEAGVQAALAAARAAAEGGGGDGPGGRADFSDLVAAQAVAAKRKAAAKADAKAAKSKEKEFKF